LNPESSIGKQSVDAQPLNQQDEKGLYRKGRELNKWGAGSYRADRPTMFFPIPGPNGEEVFPIRSDGSEGRWRLGRPAMMQIVADGDALFEKRDDGTYIVFEKIRSDAPRQKSYRTLLNDAGTSADGTAILKELFGGKSPFDFPKPIRLSSKLIEISGVDEDDIILDFFSGSCTTAHALLDLNKKDGGNRKFIMVQLPEPCDESSEAFKAGYKTIADIGKERIRRVIKKIEEDQAKQEKENAGKLPGMAKELPKLDLGFKVFKLDKSNFKLWDGSKPDISDTGLVKQLELHIDHIHPKASQEDVLYELLLKAGFKPTEKVKKKKLAGKTVFFIADGALLICLENDITRELIDAVAEAEPIQFICLDRAFKGNDQLKANAVQTFEARNQGRDKAQQIVFRTV
jgi:adenine-specific DNA-methyltransferase